MSLHAVAGASLVSFDVAAEAGHVAVLLSCPDGLAYYVAAQMRAHHPGLVLTAVDRTNANTAHAAVAAVHLGKPDLHMISVEPVA